MDHHEADQRIRTLVGHNIAQLREAAGPTQGQLADKLGFDRTQLSQWERGRKLPSAHHLQRIADHFGKEFGWFYTDHSAADDQEGAA
jgi:transcriptional regulator with XRE-family HTH domain